jgi:hypothetical protein
VSVDKLTASLIHAEPFQRRKSPFAADVIVTSDKSSSTEPVRFPLKNDNELKAVDPLPILNLFVSVINPISPDASIGLVEFQLAAVSRLN